MVWPQYLTAMTPTGMQISPSPYLKKNHLYTFNYPRCLSFFLFLQQGADEKANLPFIPTVNKQFMYFAALSELYKKRTVLFSFSITARAPQNSLHVQHYKHTSRVLSLQMGPRVFLELQVIRCPGGIGVFRGWILWQHTPH